MSQQVRSDTDRGSPPPRRHFRQLKRLILRFGCWVQRIIRGIRVPEQAYCCFRSPMADQALLARCFVRLGMLESAMKQYFLAGRSDRYLEDLYDLGLKFEAAGDRRNARACWEEVYATDIRFKDVRARICSSPYPESTQAHLLRSHL